MSFYEGLAANCVRYISTMSDILVMGIDWANLKAVAELNHIRLTRQMMRRLHVIEGLLIKESVANAERK